MNFWECSWQKNHWCGTHFSRQCCHVKTCCVVKTGKMKIFIFLCTFCQIILGLKITIKDFDDQLFGNGDFSKEDKVSFLPIKCWICWKKSFLQRAKLITKHLSSSTEDLMLLFEAERKIVKELRSNFTSYQLDVRKIVTDYLGVVDFE